MKNKLVNKKDKRKTSFSPKKDSLKSPVELHTSPSEQSLNKSPHRRNNSINLINNSLITENQYPTSARTPIIKINNKKLENINKQNNLLLNMHANSSRINNDMKKSIINNENNNKFKNKV